MSPVSSKYWTNWEIDQLLKREAEGDLGARDRILPILRGVTVDDVARVYPPLASRRCMSWGDGVDAIAREIAALVRGERPAPSHRSPIYNVPGRRAQTFVGRAEDLDRLDALVQPGARVGLAASIEGLAGVGKTELALQLVDRLSATRRFPGGIFWLDAENPDVRPTWGGAIADELAISAGNQDERVASAMRIISSGGPALIVLDNVASWTNASSPQPLPRGSHVTLLATTRRRDLGGASFQHLGIQCLAPGPARELLLAVADRDLSLEPGLEWLLRYLDGHTLAIELAGAFLRRFSWVSPAEYLARLRGGEAIDEKVTPDVRHARTVNQALRETYSRLAPVVRQALLVCGEFDDAAASLELLWACDINEDEMANLSAFHLVAPAGRCWSMHRLVRDFARRTGTLLQRRMAQRAFVAGCARRTLRMQEADNSRHIYGVDRPHLERAVTLQESVGVEVVFPGLAHDSEWNAPELLRAWMLARLGLEAFEAGRADVARDYALRAIALGAPVLGEDHYFVGSRRAELGHALLRLGQPALAREQLERALDCYLAWCARPPGTIPQLEEDDDQVAIVRTNLGLVFSALGQLERARELYQRALLSDQRRGRTSWPDHYRRLNNLAWLLEKRGDTDGARRMVESALADAIEKLGDGHDVVATLRASLASMFVDQGDLATAESLLVRVVASHEQRGDAYQLVLARKNLGEVIHGQHRCAEARTAFVSALQAAAASLGADHVETVRIRDRLTEFDREHAHLPDVVPQQSDV